MGHRQIVIACALPCSCVTRYSRPISSPSLSPFACSNSIARTGQAGVLHRFCLATQICKSAYSNFPSGPEYAGAERQHPAVHQIDQSRASPCQWGTVKASPCASQTKVRGVLALFLARVLDLQTSAARSINFAQDGD